jgi:hypothetical protein
MEPTLTRRPTFDETIPGPNNSLSIAAIRDALAHLEQEPSRRSIPGALRILYEQLKARETFVSIRSMTATSWFMCGASLAGYVFSPPALRQKLWPWAIVLGLLGGVGLLFSFRYRHSISRSSSETKTIQALTLATLERLAGTEAAAQARLDKDQKAEIRKLLKATKSESPGLLALLDSPER